LRLLREENALSKEAEILTEDVFWDASGEIVLGDVDSSGKNERSISISFRPSLAGWGCSGVSYTTGTGDIDPDLLAGGSIVT
jgi:hypothetical protein